MYRSSTLFAMAALVAVITSSCATMNRSFLLGAGAGAAVGGGTGAIVGKSVEGAAVGVATGAITGGLIGLLIHKVTEKDNSNTSSKPVSEAEKFPFLTRPEVQTIWVPDAVEGNRYIERHRVFVIEKNSSWSKDND